MDHRTGNKWSEEEVQNMVDLFEKGYKIKEIATIHQRNIGDISIKLKTLGLLRYPGFKTIQEIAEIKI